MATLKTGWMKKLIDGVYTKVFAISHAKCCYYDYANDKTVYDELGNKVNTVNPSSTGSFSHNRKSGSTVGDYSSTLGYGNIASGEYSHAEGYQTTASGEYSHAEGVATKASEICSHAEGYQTTALEYQHVLGHYNNTTTATASSSEGTGTGSAFVIGNGTGSSSSNAFRVNDNGQPFGKQGYTTQGCDYAEYFEWFDGNPDDEDRRGYFVTLDGEKIRIAEPGDYILGIVSAWPSVIGNGDEDWLGRYILDDFGACIEETFEYEVTEIDEEIGEEITVTKTGTKWKENPDYDPSIPYIERSKRKEWSTIGMLGVLNVYDDGSCEINGFCKVAGGGIATKAELSEASYQHPVYRVVNRVTDNIVRVIVK